MSQFNDDDDTIKNKIAALMRVVDAKRCLKLKKDKIPCQIKPGFFLGSVGAANNKDELKRLNITHILTVAHSLPPEYPNGFVYKIVRVADREDTDLRQHFGECFEFIDESKRQGGGTLVHCFAGRSRSVTIVVAYLMKKNGMSLSQAQEHVKSRRRHTSPNAGFITQLQAFEKSIKEDEDKETQQCTSEGSEAVTTYDL